MKNKVPSFPPNILDLFFSLYICKDYIEVCVHYDRKEYKLCQALYKVFNILNDLSSNNFKAAYNSTPEHSCC